MYYIENTAPDGMQRTGYPALAGSLFFSHEGSKTLAASASENTIGDRRCRSCGHARPGVLIDFGPQPPSNRFEKPGSHDVDRHPLRISCCPACNLIQLDEPMPVQMVRPRYPWITYNEPEKHLDQLLHRVIEVSGIDTDSRVLGVYLNDTSAIQKLEAAGIKNSSVLVVPDIFPPDQFPGMETAQSLISKDNLKIHREHHGKYDLVVCRYLFEHARHPGEFLEGLMEVLEENGSILLEVPDCSKFIDHCDYSFVWEEHCSYFCERTLIDLVRRHGLVISMFERYEYPLEDSLAILVTRKSVRKQKIADFPTDEGVLPKVEAFALAYPVERARQQELLSRMASKGERAAVFGASHLSAKFINLLGLDDGIAFVVDDNPSKQGMRMPGSRLPIVSSRMLIEGKIDLCLLALNPDSEAKVMKAQSAYLAAGGKFGSIFKLSTLRGLTEHSLQ